MIDLGNWMSKGWVLLLLVWGVASSEAALTVTSKDQALTNPQWTQPRVYVTNTGTDTQILTGIRYYFTETPGATPVLAVWDPSSATGSIVELGSGRAYVDVELGSVTLTPGQSLNWGNGVLFGLHNADWSTWVRSADWSAVAIQDSSVTNPRVVVVGGGTMQGSDGAATALSAPGCWESYAMVASGNISGGDRLHSTGSILAGQSLSLGYDVKVFSGSGYAGSDFSMKDRTAIAQNALAVGNISEGYNVVVSGITQSKSSNVPTCAVANPAGSVTTSSNDINVAQGQTLTLAPGTYRNLNVISGGTLLLSSGNYTFANFVLNPDAKIRLAAGKDPIQVATTGPFALGDRTHISFDGDSLPRRLHLTSVSTSSSVIGYDVVAFGTFAAPSAQLILHSRLNLVGGVVGASIAADPDVSVVWSASVVPVNLPPTLTISTLTVPFGWSGSVNLSIIQVSDADTPLNQLTFTITKLPAGGTLSLEGTPVNIGTTFNMIDLENGRLAYAHTNANYSTDSFGFKVSDGVNVVNGTVPVKIGPPMIVGMLGLGLHPVFVRI